MGLNRTESQENNDDQTTNDVQHLKFPENMLDSASFFLTVAEWHLELSGTDYAYGQIVRQLSLRVVSQSTKLQDQEMGILPEDRRKGSHVSTIEKKE